MRKKKRRILWGRVLAALLLLGELIFCVCYLLTPNRFVLAKGTGVPSVPGAETDAKSLPTTEASTLEKPKTGAGTSEKDGKIKKINPLESGLWYAFYIRNVPHFDQRTEFPTGCESVAAVSLLQFYGMDITVEEFIDECLPCADYPYGFDGELYGESPWEYFIGNPRSKNGYGCYFTVIKKAMETALPKHYSVDNPALNSLAEAIDSYVSKGIPVMLWATIGMQPARNGKSWILPSGEYFTFLSPEHALLLIGSDEEQYYFCDSMSEEAVTAYPKKDCELAFEALGRQALVVMEDR